MKTYTLIKWLSDIDHKLSHRTYTEERSITGTLGNKIVMPSITKQKYNGNELSNMIDQKVEIISELNKRGLIKDKEYEQYILSEGPDFTPKIKVNENNKNICST